MLWTLDQLDLEYEQFDLGGEFGGLDEEDYLVANPNGLIPTLEDGDFVLWESNTIVRYLADCYGEGSLLPDDYYDRMLASQWMDWQQTTLNSDMIYLFYALIRKSPDHQDLQERARCVERLNRKWEVLDYWLHERDYVVSDRLTMADIPLGVLLTVGITLKLSTFIFPTWLDGSITCKSCQHLINMLQRVSRQRGRYLGHLEKPIMDGGG